MRKNKYYFTDYITIDRWMSYYYQINNSLNIVEYLKKTTQSKLRILEIGIGNKIVSIILEELIKNTSIEFEIFSIDALHKLKPTVCGDIRFLPFNENIFDLILYFEVLEHIPFNDVQSALKEVKRTSRNIIFVSIPHNSLHFSIGLKVPKKSIKIFSLLTIDLPLRHDYDGEHWWELGTKGHSVNNFKELFRKDNLRLIKDFRNPFFPYHHFFILSKKDEHASSGLKKFIRQT